MILRRILFCNFHLVYRLDQWVKRRFTHTGVLLIGALIVAAVFGVNTRATHSYQLAMLILSAIGVAALSALFFRPRVSLSRRLPRFATAGRPFDYTVSLVNHARAPQRGLILRESLSAEPPAAAEFGRRLEPADAKRNWFDRYVGYPRWVSHMRWRRGADMDETTLPALPPGARRDVRVRMTPRRRGFIRLRPALIARPDPLGVFKALARAGSPESLLVLPRRYEVSWSELTGRTRDRLGGESQAASTGGPEEFASLREYRPGDPFRHIHWKGWARLGEPVVREFHEECFVRQGLILDTFLPRDASEARFEEAVSVAASFVCSAPAGSGTLELMFAGKDAHHVASGHGPRAADGMLEALACIQATQAPSFDCLSRAVLERASELSACVCVFLDYDAPRRELVSRLRRLDVPLLVLVMAESDDDAMPDAGPMSDCRDRLKRLRAGRVQEDLAADTSSTPVSAAPDKAA